MFLSMNIGAFLLILTELSKHQVPLQWLIRFISNGTGQSLLQYKSSSLLEPILVTQVTYLTLYYFLSKAYLSLSRDHLVCRARWEPPVSEVSRSVAHKGN